NKISFDNGGYGIYTYYCQNYTAPCLVANNMIYMGGSYSTNYGIYNYYYSYGFLWLNNTYHSESYYGAAVYMYYGNQGNTFYNNNFSLPYANTMYDMLYEYSSDIDSMNYNNYYTNGSGAYFNFYYSNYYDLSSWQSAYGFDANSVEIDPIFTSTTAGSDNLHITNCALKSLGLDISTYVSTDIDGTVRDTRPDMGADEDIAGTPGIWTGSYNTVWMNVDNWCGGGLPGATDNVTLNSGLPNYPVITTGNGICNDYTISSGASTTMSGGKLTVYGTFTHSGSWTATGGTTEFAKTSGTQAIPAISFLSLETSGGATKTMSADLTVDQTLTNNSTLSIGAGNKLSINGNYIGTGGITGSTTSKVAVGGGGVAPHITLPSMTLSNLTIARHNGVTISSGNLNIQDSIDMLGGILFTDTVSFSNKIVLASGGNLNESDTSYIWGTIEQTKNVPLSTDVNFGDMGVTINAATTSPGSTVVTRKQNVISGLTGHNGQAVKGFKTTWDIVPTTNTNLGATLTMHYNGAFLNNIVETSLDLFVDHGSGWDHAGLVSINTTANTITSRPQSHFSNFTLGGSFSNPLPVELISFNASLKNEVTAALVWKTASEIDNNHFDVERSVDGTTFLKVGEVAGHGTTNMESSYGFDDQFGNVLSPVLYYRLKQVDNNGTFTYSNIAKVRTTERVDGLKVWYNQGTDKIATIISVNTADKVTLKVTDQTGKVVGEQTTSVSKGNNVLELDMTGNAKGIYNFIYTSGAGTQVRRVIKY
ncbi:MAG: T9SS type A sorting domain-containing protein, partial [Bacteroidetes bacterium]|nr:T9SS type A sorting domain-containing protein [Bacteroidota bacterium]